MSNIVKTIVAMGALVVIALVVGKAVEVPKAGEMNVPTPDGWVKQEQPDAFGGKGVTLYPSQKENSSSISWQDFKAKYAFEVEVPTSWKITCEDDQYHSSCNLQSPEDVKAEEDGPEGEHAPYASLIIEVLDRRTLYPESQKKIDDIKIGSVTFNRYEVWGFGLVYGVARGDKYFQFDSIYNDDPVILSTFKFTK